MLLKRLACRGGMRSEGTAPAIALAMRCVLPAHGARAASLSAAAARSGGGGGSRRHHEAPNERVTAMLNRSYLHQTKHIIGGKICHVWGRRLGGVACDGLHVAGVQS